MRKKKTMVSYVEDYLANRRAVGIELRIEGRQLMAYARFADSTACGQPLTTELAVKWAHSASDLSRKGQARRLEVVRPFARYLSAICPETEIPPTKLLGPAHERIQPHIYSNREIHALLSATSLLLSRDGLRHMTIRAYLGLLACTGMRPQEPQKLRRSDVDLQQGSITLRKTKFCKSRLIALHPTSVRALKKYVLVRDRLAPKPCSDAFFLVDGGEELTSRKVRTAFNYIRRKLGWTDASTKRPRLYDLRHSFICHRLLEWYREGVDVHNAMPALSTYVGHVKVTDTYWYLTGIPELLSLIGERFERFANNL